MDPVRKINREVGGYHLMAALEGEELEIQMIPPDGHHQFQAKYNPDSLTPLATQLFYDLENIFLCLAE